MSALAWTVAVLLAVPVAYTALCLVLLFVRFPDGPPFGIVEDLVLVVTAPFVAIVVGATLLRNGR